jgi:hypothetical protein
MSPRAPCWRRIRRSGKTSPGSAFDRAVKLIAAWRMANATLDPPLVSLEAILRRGWEADENGAVK